MEHSAGVAMSPVSRALVRVLQLAGFVFLLWLLAGTTAAHADDHDSGQGDGIGGQVRQVARAVGDERVAEPVERAADTVEQPVRRTTDTVRRTVDRTADVVREPVRRTTQVVDDTVERTTAVVHDVTGTLRDRVESATGQVGDTPGTTAPERADRDLRGDALASRSASTTIGTPAPAADAPTSTPAQHSLAQPTAALASDPVPAPTPAPTVPHNDLPEGGGGSAGSSASPVATLATLTVASPGSVLVPTAGWVQAFRPARASAPGSTPD